MSLGAAKWLPIVSLVVLAGCSAAPAPPPVGPASALPTATTTAEPTATATQSPSPSEQPSASAAEQAPNGTWQGELGDDTATFPVFLQFADCVAIGEVCGEIEYSDPQRPELVFCAPTLTFQGFEDGRSVFVEGPGYRPMECFPSTLKFAFTDATTMEVEQYGDDGPAFGHGELHQLTADVPEPTAVPPLAAIEGLGSAKFALDLGGWTTQYASGSESRAYFPVPGRVVDVDLASGAATDLASYDNPTAADDPHSVWWDDDGLWVARAEDRTLELLDAAGQSVQSVDLDQAPYAMTVDGDTVWVTSFFDSMVMRVNATSGEVEATIEVENPTGIAVGGGSVWVIEHRLNNLLRIDSQANEVADTISLGEGGEDPVCGMCVENVIFAHGSVWTANNWGRSVSRIDPDTLEVTTIPTEHRAWAVTAGDDAIWASQMRRRQRSDRSFAGRRRSS